MNQIPVFSVFRSKVPEKLTLLSALLSWFPTVIIVAAVSSLIWIGLRPSFLSCFSLIFVVYGFPVLAYRLHQRFYPVKEGISYLLGKEYSPWWGSHQFQVIYIAFPFLESLLRLIPGVFSAWLRLWGAKIGQNIYWTPKLEIADRGLIEIGDRVVFGYGVELYSHVIKPKNENLTLYVKPIKIGDNVFLGAGSRLGPGVKVKDKSYLPITTDLSVNQKAGLQ
ncbi:MAG: DapH/DapD/GlmU-related protein [Cyanobacteriota bacterium]|nr:DapH/DapD/GlmU-related protein [Cyanobacteriota bacterium]